MRKVFPLSIFAVLTVAFALAKGKPVAAQTPTPVDNAERIATFAKPAVTRLYAGCTGTYVWQKGGANRQYRTNYYYVESAFFINPNGYLLTSADAVVLVKELNDTCKEYLFRRYVRNLARDYNIDVSSLTQTEYTNVYNDAARNSRLFNFGAINLVRLPNGKDLPFEIKAFGAVAGKGKDVAVLKVEIKNAPVLKLGDSDKVRLQEPVTVAGYPWAADTDQQGILSDESYLQASFTNGRISAKKTAADGSPVLQISAPVSIGLSGGPVLNDAGEVIGLYAFQGDQVYQQDVQGFSFAVGSNTALEFIRQAGTTNEEGPADIAYREGMELFWKGKYTAAIAKFQEVKNLFPQHAETDKLIQEAQERKTKFGDTPDPTPEPVMPAKTEGKQGGISGARTAAIGVLALAGLGAAAGAVMLLQQNRRRRTFGLEGSASLPPPAPNSYDTPWPSPPSNGFGAAPTQPDFGPSKGNVSGQYDYTTSPRAGGGGNVQGASQPDVGQPTVPYPVAAASPVAPPAKSTVPTTAQLARGRTCHNCGTALRVGAPFCSGCGTHCGA